MPDLKKILVLLVLGILIPGAVYAAEKTASQEDEIDQADPLFTGVKYQNKSTTLVQGTELGIDPANFGGGLRTSDLSQFQRHVVSVSDGNGTFTWSEQVNHSNTASSENRGQ